MSLPKIITSSQFAQTTLMLKGKPFNFDLHAPFRDVYNWPKERIILKTARQVGKSTFLSAFALTTSARKRHYRTFYASTSERQAKEFARVKLNELLTRSPRIRKILFNKNAGEINDSVFDKQFSNGSGITISYMRDDADRTRGYSADSLMLDEVQDMDPNELPVVEEILSASLDPSRFYTGTPKTMDNHIEYKWSQSTMHEVFFKCNGCRKYNSIGYKSIGKRWPICTHCGGKLDITQPHLIPTYSKDGKDPYYLGVRIPQPALMLHSGFENKWKDLLIKFETYDEAKFCNEVLGISHSTGTRFVTEDDIIEQCLGSPVMPRPDDRLFQKFDLLVMGIDWTGDGQNNVSKNAAVIYGRLAGDPKQRMQVVYKKIWPRQDFMKTMEEIVMTANIFRVSVIGADAGEGALNNAYLAKHLGAHRVQPFRYGAFNLPAKLSEDKRTIYLDKTQALDDFFMHLKQGQFILPPFETFQEESSHLLSLFEVVTRAGRRIYSHSPSAPDDFAHAMTFGYNAYKIAIGQLKFY
jgi:hypothetical protein